MAAGEKDWYTIMDMKRGRKFGHADDSKYTDKVYEKLLKKNGWKHRKRMTEREAARWVRKINDADKEL